MEDKLGLQNNLAQIRKGKGFSQTALVKMVDVSRIMVGSIETSQFNPTAKPAFVLCTALDKKFEDVFYFR